MNAKLVAYSMYEDSKQHCPKHPVSPLQCVVSRVKLIDQRNWMQHIHAAMLVNECSADEIDLPAQITTCGRLLHVSVRPDRAETLISGTLHAWHLFCIEVTIRDPAPVQVMSKKVIDIFTRIGVPLWENYNLQKTEHGYKLWTSS